MPVIAASVAFIDQTIFKLSGRLFGQKDDITAPAPKNASCEISCSTLKPLMRLRGHMQSESFGSLTAVPMARSKSISIEICTPRSISDLETGPMVALS
jgi:hypothetical protein